MLGEGATPLTVSAGIGSWWRDEPLEMLLARADSALYEAKRNGRNRSIVGGRSDVDVATHPPVVTA
jgi:PleD family two-component response regulator